MVETRTRFFALKTILSCNGAYAFVAIVSQDTMTLFRDSTTTNLKIYEPSIVLRTLNNMQKKISTNNIFGLKKEEIPKNKYLAWINSNGEF